MPPDGFINAAEAAEPDQSTTSTVTPTAAAAPDPYNIQAALKAGYNVTEIADYLGRNGVNIAGARKAGYLDDEILSHLIGKAPEPEPAPEPKPEEPVSSTWEGWSKAIGQDVIGLGGTALKTGGDIDKGLGAAAQAGARNAADVPRLQLDIIDKIDSGEPFKAQPADLGSRTQMLNGFGLAYAASDADTRARIRDKITAQAAVKPEDTLLSKAGSGLTALGGAIHGAGEAVTDFGERQFPLTDEEQQRWTVRGTHIATGLAPYIVAAAGGLPALAAVAGFQGYGSAFEEAKKAGASDEDAAVAGVLGGAVDASLVAVPLHTAMNVLAKVPSQLKGEFVKTVIDMAKASGTGVTFAQMQTVADNLVAKQTYDPDRPVTQNVGKDIGLQAAVFALLPFAPYGAKVAGRATRGLLNRVLPEGPTIQPRPPGEAPPEPPPQAGLGAPPEPPPASPADVMAAPDLDSAIKTAEAAATAPVADTAYDEPTTPAPAATSTALTLAPTPIDARAEIDRLAAGTGDEQQQAALIKLFSRIPGTVEQTEDGGYQFRTKGADGNEVTHPIAVWNPDTEPQAESLNPNPPPSTRTPISSATANALREHYAQAGVDVIFYKDHDAIPFDGAVDPNQPNTIFLSNNPERAVAQVANHEFTHILASTTLPDGTNLGALLNQQIAEGITPAGRRHAEKMFGSTAPQRANFPDDQSWVKAVEAHLYNELGADIGGEAPKFQSFMPRVIDAIQARYGDSVAANLLSRLLDGLRRTMQTIRELFTEGGPRSRNWISNLEDVHDTLAKMYAERFGSQAEREQAAQATVQDRVERDALVTQPEAPVAPERPAGPATFEQGDRVVTPSGPGSVYGTTNITIGGQSKTTHQVRLDSGERGEFAPTELMAEPAARPINEQTDTGAADFLDQGRQAIQRRMDALDAQMQNASPQEHRVLDEEHQRLGQQLESLTTTIEHLEPDQIHQVASELGFVGKAPQAPGTPASASWEEVRDALHGNARQLRRWLGELGNERDAAAAATPQARLLAQTEAAILRPVGGDETKLPEPARARLEAVREKLDEVTHPAADTPPMTTVRGELAKTSDELVQHTTKKGKVLTGTVRKDLTQEQAKKLDPFAFRKDGGFFIRQGRGDKPAIPQVSPLAASSEQPAGTQRAEPAPATPAPVESTPSPKPPPAPPAAKQEVANPDHALAERVAERIARGEPIDARTLQADAEQHYGGTLAQGAYSRDRHYDAVELGVNRYIQRHPDWFNPRLDAPRAMQVARDLATLKGNLPTQTVRAGEKDAYQQFSTPPDYAYAASWVANLQPADHVLEPSAGVGGLIVHAMNAGVRETTANELSDKRRGMITLLNPTRVTGEDAAQLHNILPADVRPTVVVMNPPFSRAAERMGGRMVADEGAKHIEQALARLEPGGRLVAIVGDGMKPEGTGPEGGGRQGTGKAFADWWRKIGAEYDVRANVGVDRDIYTKYGTSFPTRFLVIDKNPPSGRPMVTGQVRDAAALIEKLQDVRNERSAVEPVADQPGRAEMATGGPDVAGSDGELHRPTGGLGAGEERLGGAAAGVTEPAGTPQSGIGGGEPAGVGRPAGGEGVGVVPVQSEPGRTGAGGQPGGRAGAGGQPGGRGSRGSGDGIRPDGSGERDEPGVTPAPEPVLAVENATAAPDTHAVNEAVYEPYKPQRVRIAGAKAHPGALVQSAAMASVAPPASSYQPRIPAALVKSGALSDAQLEAIVYAGHAHSDVMADGKRRGFFIGDGTGVGKGREIAGIILDNKQNGRTKAIWISEKRALINDAKRDWNGLGQPASDVIDHGKLKPGDPIKGDKGILFSSYDTLKSAEQTKNEAGKVRGKERVDQIIDWVGKDFDGVIAFDEAHNMGNSTDQKGGRGVKKAAAKALAAMRLQQELPNARVVYVSATGATEVSNLAYADRLGLWGEGTAFANRSDFLGSVSSGGIAGMELVARDMKALGHYIARNLSYDGVDYDRVEHTLSADQRQTYDKLAEGWQLVLRHFNAALMETGAVGENGKTQNGKAKSAAMSAFWGAHQRFFNQIITSMQMPSVIRGVEADIKAGRQAVLQLVNTMEAAQERALEKARASGEGELEDLDMTPRDQLMQMIEKSYPVQQMEDYIDDNGNKRSRPAVDSKGQPVLNRKAVAARDRLLDEIGSIRVPDGPLEMLMNHFGTDKVAEVTGRKQRVVRKPDEAGQMKTIVEPRGGQANVAEASAFQAGKKPILVFSEAGGTGRSYHAAIGTPSEGARRSHYLVQGGWRADKAVQGFGRTHRTSQASAPIFHLVTTDLQGQKRFISSIARRLAQLGALTKGERRAADQGLFSARDNLESTEARDGLTQFFKDVAMGQVEGVTMDDLEKAMGLKMRDENGALASPLPEMSTFLNRVLSLTVDHQNRVFQAFSDRMDTAIARASAAGTLDTGVETYKADKISKVSEQTVYTDPRSGAETKHVHLNAQNRNDPVSFADTLAGRNKTNGMKPDTFIQNARSGRVFAVTTAGNYTDKDGRIVPQVRLTSPIDYQFLDRDKVDRDNWKRLTVDQAKPLWDQQVAATPEFRNGSLHIITGAVLPIWDRLGGNPKIFRLQTDTGERMLGRVVPSTQVDATLRALGAEGLRVTATPGEVARQVLDGATARLANGWTIKRSFVAGEQRLEVVGPDYRHGEELTRNGVFSERIQYNTRFFIPTEPRAAAAAIEAITRTRPVTALEGGGVQFSPRVRDEEELDARRMAHSRITSQQALIDDTLKRLREPGITDEGVFKIQQRLQRARAEYATRVNEAAQLGVKPGDPFPMPDRKGDVQFSPRVRDEEEEGRAPLYSALTQAVEGVKQEKAAPGQWLATLKNMPGVKPEERAWTGLDEWLGKQPRSVTKAEVLDYLRANQIQVREVTRGGEDPQAVIDRARQAYNDAGQARNEARDRMQGALAGTNYQIKIGDDRLWDDELQRGLEIGHIKPDQLPEAHGLREAAAAYVDAYNAYEAAYNAFESAHRYQPTGQVTKFSSYTLPGGENYREMLLTLPTPEAPPYGRIESLPNGKFVVDTVGGQRALFNTLAEAEAETRRLGAIFNASKVGYRSSHWNEPNVVAHMRFSERTAPDGARVLHVEEVQSDWHQEGRKKGYATQTSEYRVQNTRSGNTSQPFATRAEAEAYRSGLPETIRAATTITERTVRSDGGVPDAPFKTTWPMLAMKRMITWAVDHGFDRVAWTPGSEQADRYSLAKHLSSLHVNRRPDGRYDLKGAAIDDGRTIDFGVKTEADLPGAVGKDLADKIINDPRDRQVLSGEGGLKVGGAGMRAFYDKQLPSEVQKLVGKFGAKVGQSEIETTPGYPGQFAIRDRQGNFVRSFGSRQAALDYIARPRNGLDGATIEAQKPAAGITQPVHSVDITDKLRDTVQAQGLPLFSPKATVRNQQEAERWTPEEAQAYHNVGRIGDERSIIQRISDAKKDIGRRLVLNLVDPYIGVKRDDPAGYVGLRNANTSTGALNTFLQQGTLRFSGSTYDFATRNGGVEHHLVRPLRGEADRFLWWVAANRAEKLTGEDRENLFSQQDIDTLKDTNQGQVAFDYTLPNGQVTRSREAIFNDSLRKLEVFNKNALDLAKRSGLISEDVVNALIANPFYVPFYRLADRDGHFAGPAVTSGFVKQYAFKTLKGGKQKLRNDLWGNAIQNWAHMIDAALRNRAAAAVLDVAVTNGAATELTQAQYDHLSRDDRADTVWIMNDGKKQYFHVDDPMLLTAITALHDVGENPILKVAAKFRTTLTRGVAASPLFMLRNFIRDGEQAIAVSPTRLNILANIRRGFAMGDAPRALMNIARAVAARETQPLRLSDEAVSAIAGGATMSFAREFDSHAQKANVRSVMGPNQQPIATVLDTPGKIAAFWHWISSSTHAYEKAAAESENVQRRAIYHNLKAGGTPHDYASYEGRDLTDFTLRGASKLVRTLTTLVPFLNARLQGLYKVGRAAANADRNVAVAVGRRIAVGAAKRMAIVLGAMTLTQLALDWFYADDEDYKKRDEYDRSTYFWFKVGNTQFRIPMGFEIAAISRIAADGVEAFFGTNEMTGQRFLNNLYHTLGTNLSMNPTPQIAKPLADVWQNQSWSGAPIVTKGMDRLQSEYQYNASTTMPARWASSAGNWAARTAGGPSAQFLSPVQIDYLVNGYFGWLGSTVMTVADLTARGIDQAQAAVRGTKPIEPVRPNVDMWSRATGGMISTEPTRQSRYIDMLYEQGDAITKAYNTYRFEAMMGHPEEAQSVLRKNQDLIARYGQITGIERQEADLNRMIKQVGESETMTAAQKHDEILRLNAIRNAAAESIFGTRPSR